MVINIRGTSGAGKTHLVKRMMALADKGEAWWPSDSPTGLFGLPTNRPAGHIIATPSGRCLLLGNYEGVQCGGCDQLMKEPWKLTRDEVFALIRRAAPDFAHIVFEGLLISEVLRCVSLRDSGFDIAVLNIDEPIETCLNSIIARRTARGVTKPLNPKLTVEKHRELRNQINRLKAAGVAAHNVSRSEAWSRLVTLLGWNMVC